MKRIFVSCAVAAGLVPAAAFALGIGELNLESRLNEPFEARIALLSVTREELDSINIRLADAEAFERAGVDRPFVLSNLRFELVETEAGADYIRVSSSDPIREPFLNFLVEVSWSKGRLYREYTVLLDPPLYSPGPPAYTRAPAPAPAPAMVESPPAAEPGPAYSAEPEYAAAPAFTGSQYGPTESTDTLWSIAGRTRPDEGVTMQQMMLALLRANPEAFISGNVNGLRRGAVLQVPSRDELTAMSAEEALAEVKSQYALWEDLRGTIAAAPAERPATSSAAAPAATSVSAPVAVEETTELRLVAATESGSGAEQGGGGATAQLNDQLAITREQMATVSQENAELKDKLTESEAIIADLKRLISLKDDELAALQQQMAAGAAEPPPATAAPVEPTEEEEGEEEETPAATPEAETEPPAEEPVPEEAEAPEPEGAAPATGKTAPAEKPAAPAPEPTPPAASLVDQAIAFVTSNLIIVGGVLGAIVLLIGGMIAVGKFRSRMEATAATPLDEFPDFTLDESAEEAAAEVGSEDVTSVREGDAAASAAEEPAGKDDATAFALPPEPKPKAAAAAKPAAAAPAEPAAPEQTAEEALDAFHHEVNVFMAYEDWDQAEQFVRDAIEREPKNLDFHAKLLEVFFTSGNRKNYEAAAKVLHDIVDGSGPYWDNAVVMWQEMSPNRALFAEGGEEDEAPAATATGGGLLDLTAAASREEGGLDFDLGDATAEPAAKPAAAGDEAMLDITAGAEDAAPAEAEAESGDMLDVTAAVGLEPEDSGLDLEPSSQEESVLDLTGGADEPKEDLLDVSGAGGDLLDVTAQTDVGADMSGEDLLDVTSTAASAKSESEPAEETPAVAEESVGEHTLDFNLEDIPEAPAVAEESAEQPETGGNVIEFESSGGGLELDTGKEAAGGAEEESSLSLELDAGEPVADGESDSGGLELDLTIDEEPAAEAEAPPDEIDMDGTVEIPKLELADQDEDDDDDDEDHTVFVPRSGDAQEQSAEDEIATKLDLAKAYVELGDKESAKGILDQVLAEGTDQQKKKAQELIRQMS